MPLSDAQVTGVQHLLNGRAQYVTTLPDQTLNLFMLARNLVGDLCALVNLLAPANGQDILTAQGFREALDLLGSNPGALSAWEARDLLKLLQGAPSGINPTQVLELLRELCPAQGNRLTPKELSNLVRRLRTGRDRLTGDQVRRLLRVLGHGEGALSPPRVLEVLNDLHPTDGNNGQQVNAAVMALRTNNDGLSGTKIGDLVRLLRNHPGHQNALDGTAIRRLLVDLTTGEHGLTGLEVQGLLVRLVGTGAGQLRATEAQTLLTRLRRNLTAKQIHKLATTSTPATSANGGRLGNGFVRPRWLLVLSGLAVQNGTVAQVLAGVNETEATLASILRHMDLLGLPTNWVWRLLQLLPNVPAGGDGRVKKLLRFVRDGRAVAGEQAAIPWQDRVLDHLNCFLQAGRSPHGNQNTLEQGDQYNWEQTRFVAGGQNNPGYLFIFTEERINYFCRAHTFRHCDWGLIERADTISFWPPAKTRQSVIADFTQLTNAWLRALAETAIHNGYAEQMQNNAFEVGLADGGAYHDQGQHPTWEGASKLFVNHLVPGAQLSASRDALKAIRHLFR
jgi:hypothetical protein